MKVTLRLDQLDKLDPDQQAALKQQAKTSTDTLKELVAKTSLKEMMKAAMPSAVEIARCIERERWASLDQSAAKIGQQTYERVMEEARLGATEGIRQHASRAFETATMTAATAGLDDMEAAQGLASIAGIDSASIASVRDALPNAVTAAAQINAIHNRELLDQLSGRSAMEEAVQAFRTLDAVDNWRDMMETSATRGAFNAFKHLEQLTRATSVASEAAAFRVSDVYSAVGTFEAVRAQALSRLDRLQSIGTSRNAVPGIKAARAELAKRFDADRDRIEPAFEAIASKFRADLSKFQEPPNWKEVRALLPIAALLALAYQSPASKPSKAVKAVEAPPERAAEEGKPRRKSVLTKANAIFFCAMLSVLLDCIQAWGMFHPPASNIPETKTEAAPSRITLVVSALNGVRLRAHPNTKAAVRATLPNGALVRFQYVEAGWAYVDVLHKGQVLVGWVAAEYLASPDALFFDEPPASTELAVPARAGAQLPAIREIPSSDRLPELIADAGDRASRRYVEFFTASIRNKNTRAAYWHACTTFLDASAADGLALAQVEPVHVAAYIERLSQERSAPTVKQHLAAIRRMFDFLVVGQVIPSSPASSVRGPKHVVTEGKTPILDADEARKLFDQFDISELGDLRDRAILGTMVYSFARVGALVKLRVRDYYRQGAKAWFVLDDKGGKQNRVPAHHLAAEYVEQYIEHAGIGLQRDMPLFRSFGRGRGRNQVTERGLGREEIFAIVRRRSAAAGLPPEIGCHSFRGTGITNYLQHGGTIEAAAKMAGHISTRTTQIYDRRHIEVPFAEIERIRF